MFRVSFNKLTVLDPFSTGKIEEVLTEYVTYLGTSPVYGSNGSFKKKIDDAERGLDSLPIKGEESLVVTPVNCIKIST